jgi:hypothetical protein
MLPFESFPHSFIVAITDLPHIVENTLYLCGLIQLKISYKKMNKLSDFFKTIISPLFFFSSYQLSFVYILRGFSTFSSLDLVENFLDGPALFCDEKLAYLHR